jgi:hypothetical protein
MTVIQATGDFKRIAAIPRRDWGDTAVEAADLLTEHLRTLTGRQALWPIQGAALADLYNYRGLFAPIKVSGGKTLISLLAPTLLESERPALLLPARLIEKTLRAQDDLSWHWRVARNLRIFSYESLGRVSGLAELASYAPDLIIADEAHRLKNTKAAVTKRVARYMKERPSVMFAGMSGTFERKSIREYAHLLGWAQRQSNYYPLPHSFFEMQEWSDCLDERALMERPHPGALLTLPGAGDLDVYVSAKHAYRKRLRETPGVVASTGEERPDCALIVGDCEVPGTFNEVDDLISTVRATYETPEGFALTEAPQVWSHVRQLSLGFYYRYVQRPSEEWFEARREWAEYAREKMRYNDLDSEKHVALTYPDALQHTRWAAQRDAFKPETEAVWIDDAVVQFCAEWLAATPKGIVWVDYVEFGRRLSTVSGRPFFHADARDDSGAYVLDANGPIVASVHTINEGLDLQYKWSDNLIISPMRNSGKLEQILGRTHRFGQVEDEVYCTFGVNCIEHVEAIGQCLIEAQHVHDTIGDMHKLLYCDRTLTPIDHFYGRAGGRWQSTR